MSPGHWTEVTTAESSEMANGSTESGHGNTISKNQSEEGVAGKDCRVEDIPDLTGKVIIVTGWLFRPCTQDVR